MVPTTLENSLVQQNSYYEKKTGFTLFFMCMLGLSKLIHTFVNDNVFVPRQNIPTYNY